MEESIAPCNKAQIDAEFSRKSLGDLSKSPSCYSITVPVDDDDLGSRSYLFAADELDKCEINAQYEEYTCSLCKETISWNIHAYINHLSKAEHMKLLFEWLLCCKDIKKYKVLIQKLRALKKSTGMFCEICKKASFSVKDLSAYKTHLKSQKHEDFTQALIEKFHQKLSSLTSSGFISPNSLVSPGQSQCDDVTTGSPASNQPSFLASNSTVSNSTANVNVIGHAEPNRDAQYFTTSLVSQNEHKDTPTSNIQEHPPSVLEGLPSKPTDSHAEASDHNTRTGLSLRSTPLPDRTNKSKVFCSVSERRDPSAQDADVSTENHKPKCKEVSQQESVRKPSTDDSTLQCETDTGPDYSNSLLQRLLVCDKKSKKRSRSPSNSSLESGEIRDSRSPSWSPDRLAIERLSPEDALSYKLADSLENVESTSDKNQRSKFAREKIKTSPLSKRHRGEKIPALPRKQAHSNNNDRRKVGTGTQHNAEHGYNCDGYRAITDARPSHPFLGKSALVRAPDIINRTPSVSSLIIVPQKSSISRKPSHSNIRDYNNTSHSQVNHTLSSHNSKQVRVTTCKERSKSRIEHLSEKYVHTLSLSGKKPTTRGGTSCSGCHSVRPSSSDRRIASREEVIESLADTETAKAGATPVQSKEKNNAQTSESRSVKEPGVTGIVCDKAKDIISNDQLVSEENQNKKNVVHPKPVSCSDKTVACMDGLPAVKSYPKRQHVSAWTFEFMLSDIQDKWKRFNISYYCQGVRNNLECLKLQTAYLQAYKGYFIEDPKLEVVFNKLRTPELLKAYIDKLSENETYPALPTFPVIHNCEARDTDSHTVNTDTESYTKSEPKHKDGTNPQYDISSINQLQLHAILSGLREKLNISPTKESSESQQKLLLSKDPFVDFIHSRLSGLLKITILQEQMDAAAHGDKELLLRLMSEQRHMHEEMVTPEGHLFIKLSRCCISKPTHVLYSYPKVSRSAIDTIVTIDKDILRFIADTPTLSR